MKISIAQLNPVVGDLVGNTGRVAEVFTRLAGTADLIVFSELFLVAYPPRDLLEKPGLIAGVNRAVAGITELSRRFTDTGIIVGAPMPSDQECGKGLYNAALLIYRGQVQIQAKSLLPCYDVFDETRYFTSPEKLKVFAFKDHILGISVCEDAWYDFEQTSSCKLYAFNPIEELVRQGADLLINISASPFYCGKEEIRHRLIRQHCQKYRRPFVYVNQVGGNDELIFDGNSMILDDGGEVLQKLPGFIEAVETVDLGRSGGGHIFEPMEKIASVHEAIILGLRDYLRKCGFSKAVVGLSGGVDSAVTCYLAKVALGAENVLGIIMPSLYSSPGSITDSQTLAENIEVKTVTIPITTIYQAYLESFREHFPVGDLDVSLENIQARIRGNILMAFSNKYGFLVLSTGNKSELSVGYCTLYGDMSGGLAVISDVPKTMVYELARYINRQQEVIPAAILTKAPSAELRPDQKDQDTLPPYEILDQVLEYYINEGLSWEDITAKGFNQEVVRWIVRAVDLNEYKRRQAAPGLKITSKAFGTGRRMPIAARYRI